MATLNFDSTNVTPDTGIDPIPAGDYTCMIIDSDMKPTKNGQGQYLELIMQVIDGPYANRLLWDRITLVHPNNKTVEIAQRQLSAICHAVGVIQVQDSAQLHNRPIIVRVKFVQDQRYGDKNEVGSYKAIAGQQQSSPAQPAYQPPAQAPAQQWPAQGQPAPTQPAPVHQAPAQQGMPWQQQPAPQPIRSAAQQPAQTPTQPAPQAAASEPPPWARPAG